MPEGTECPQALSPGLSTVAPKEKVGVGRIVAAAVFALMGLAELVSAVIAGVCGIWVGALVSIATVCLMWFLSLRILQRRIGLLGIAGSLVLAFVALFVLPGIEVAIRWGEYVSLLGQVGAVSLIWLLSTRIRRAWARLFLRAVSLSLAFTPFIPHAGVQWSTPWPPAALWVATGLSGGHLAVFELVSILITLVVVWLALLAVHHDCSRYRGHPVDSEATS
jgi:hypothetical protein